MAKEDKMITFTQGTKAKLKNKRSMPRWNTQGHCIYRVNNDAPRFEGHVKDVNCSGTCLITNQDISIDQKIHLTIHISDSDVIRVSGIAIWKRISNKENMIGIRFFNASSETQDKILQYALYTDRETLVNHWFDGWEGRQPSH